MKMKQLPLDDAADQQIYDYCEAMDLAPGDTHDRMTLMALLAQVWPHAYIMVPDFPENDEQVHQTRVTPQQRLEGGVGQNDPRVVVKIGTTNMPGGNQPVPVSVNGRAVVVQRNMRVDMPYRYYLALQNAVRAEVSQDEQSKDLIETQVRNYPMEVLELPTEAEIREFHERTNDVMMPA